MRDLRFYFSEAARFPVSFLALLADGATGVASGSALARLHAFVRSIGDASWCVTPLYPWLC